MGEVVLHFMEIDLPNSGMKEVHSEIIEADDPESYQGFELGLVYQIADDKEQAEFLVWDLRDVMDDGEVFQRHIVLVRDEGFRDGWCWEQ
jgi:hypothetical protein